MKKTFFSITLAVLALLLTAGCSLFNEFTDEIPEGYTFYTGCPVSFFFVDEEGTDLVDPSDSSTYPVAFPGQMRILSMKELDFSIYETEEDGSPLIMYNDNTNSLWKDPEQQRWSFRTWLWGVTKEKDYRMYVYYGSQEDSLTVSYKYLKAGDPGSEKLPAGSSWGVEILSMRYNDVEVYVGNENGKAFIEKPSQGGETVVHVGSI